LVIKYLQGEFESCLPDFARRSVCYGGFFYVLGTAIPGPAGFVGRGPTSVSEFFEVTAAGLGRDSFCMRLAQNKQSSLFYRINTLLPTFHSGILRDVLCLHFERQEWQISYWLHLRFEGAVQKSQERGSYSDR
jgi:hypothetical protein